MVFLDPDLFILINKHEDVFGDYKAQKYQGEHNATPSSSLKFNTLKAENCFLGSTGKSRQIRV